MKTILTLSIEHDKPIPHLADMVAGRAYTIDSVRDVGVCEGRAAPKITFRQAGPEVVELLQAGFTLAEIRLGATEVERG
jgi:hypothetical protein